MPHGAAMEGQLRRVLGPALFHAPTPARSRGREPKRPHEARLQPAREYRANKSKENQINPRKKAWISLDSFGRFGTFQCVTGNPNKKISRALNSRVRLCAKRLQRSFPLSPGPPPHKARRRSGDWESYSTDPGFGKAIGLKIVVSGLLRPIARQINPRLTRSLRYPV